MLRMQLATPPLILNKPNTLNDSIINPKPTDKNHGTSKQELTHASTYIDHCTGYNNTNST